MTAAFLTVLLFLQGIPVAPAQSGSVSGTLRGPDGKPLPYVRMAAVAPTESLNDRSSSSMSSIAETDEQGHYRLEGIPQGRYYIAAGRVDFPTYYPGTQEISGGKTVSVAAGEDVSGIDFAQDLSSTRLPADPTPNQTRVYVPIQVAMNDGGKVPISAGGIFPEIHLTATSNRIALTARLADLAVPVQSGDYDVQVDNLPDGYTVDAITYGSTNLRNAPLQIPTAFTSITGAVVLLSGSASGPRPKLSTISIVLKRTPAAQASSGVRVSGRVRVRGAYSVYLSGTGGTYYGDGSFEFLGVPPGKHLLLGLDTEAPLGAFVVVGNRDLEGVELSDTASPAPFNLRSAREPEPPRSEPPGSVLPLASLHGTVMDEDANKPLAEGVVKITGYAKTELFPISAEGRFEIPRLFPGEYTIALEVQDYEHLFKTITVSDQNITLDLTTRRIY